MLLSKEALEKKIKSLENAIDIAIKTSNGEALYECLSLLELYNAILKDLDRLEKLEAKDKKWQELFGCDLCEVLGRELLKEENEKLKKAIEILKDNNSIKFLGYNKYGAKPYEIMINGVIIGFDKEQYELLKEVFGNEN